MAEPVDNPGVASWYDRNTRWFLRVGRGADQGAIHRELWGPGVTTVDQAVAHVDALVAEGLGDVGASPRLLDLGCGVGGSTCRMVGLKGGAAVGLTVSPAQVALATERAARLGLADRVSFVLGDFLAPPDLGVFDGAWAIESFVHGADPARFFAAAARLLRPGARLVVVDDFLARDEAELPPEGVRRVREMREGWRMGSLLRPEAAVACAAGFAPVDDRDLTPLLNLWRPRDHLVAAWVAASSWAPIDHPYQASLIGGNALQYALSNGWTTYRRLVLERQDTGRHPP